MPIDTPDPLDKYKWWILGAITLVFAVGAGFLLRRPGDDAAAEVAAAAECSCYTSGVCWRRSRTSFSRWRRTIFKAAFPTSEYEQQKQALELVLRRALARKPA